MSAKPNEVAKKADPFVQRIESLNDQMESKRGEYMKYCANRREDIKNVLGEAKDAGIPVKAMKGIVKRRMLEKKILGIDDDFDVDEQATYIHLAEQLGALGEAAAKSKGIDPNKRDDEANLARVGRGNGQPAAPH